MEYTKSYNFRAEWKR